MFMLKLRSSSSIICSLSMNDEDTLTFDDWVSFLLSSSRKYIGRELTSNIPEKTVQISAGLTVDALAHDRVTKAYPQDLPFFIGITTSST